MVTKEFRELWTLIRCKQAQLPTLSCVLLSDKYIGLHKLIPGAIVHYIIITYTPSTTQPIIRASNFETESVSDSSSAIGALNERPVLTTSTTCTIIELLWDPHVINKNLQLLMRTQHAGGTASIHACIIHSLLILSAIYIVYTCMPQ